VGIIDVTELDEIDPEETGWRAIGHKGGVLGLIVGGSGGGGVVDATTVAAAGAVMNTEVDADIKTLALPENVTISAFSKDLLDDVDAAAARSTLGVPAVADLADTVVLTQAEYNALTRDPDTIYYIVG
jgi:hypothetical protein